MARRGSSQAICAGDCRRLSKSRDKHVKVRPLQFWGRRDDDYEKGGKSLWDLLVEYRGTASRSWCSHPLLIALRGRRCEIAFGV